MVTDRAFQRISVCGSMQNGIHVKCGPRFYSGAPRVRFNYCEIAAAMVHRADIVVSLFNEWPARPVFEVELQEAIEYLNILINQCGILLRRVGRTSWLMHISTGICTF